jgi:two-component system, LytTR family, sensor kinase
MEGKTKLKGTFVVDSMKQYRTIFIHITAWLVYFLTQLFGATSLNENFWIIFACTNIPVIVLFYSITEFVFPHYFKKGKYPLLVFMIILLLLFSVVLRFILAMIILNGTLSDLMDSSIGPMFWGQLRIGILFAGISFAVWYAKRNYQMTINQQLLQKEIVDAQLLSLKNQINPHFLYNTLSFLYTKSLPLSKELSDAIAKLSEMMRYSLGEAGGDGKVKLASEINHLKNFIDIHQLRFGNVLAINFTIQGDIEKHKIVPLLLITFVENAFKHGKVNDKENPLTIALHANPHSYHFSITNKKSNGTKEKSSGIGLVNIKNRLDLVYPDKHTLHITDTKDLFTIELTIED